MKLDATKKIYNFIMIFFIVFVFLITNTNTLYAQECPALPSNCAVTSVGLNCLGWNHCGYAPFDNVNDNYCNVTPVGELCCSSSCPVYSFCGDGTCNSGENNSTCSSDCAATPYCGDGVCNNGETSYTCSNDCGAPPLCVTDGFCSSFEITNHCSDCSSTGPTCSGGGEDCWGVGNSACDTGSGFVCDGSYCVYNGSEPSCGINAENGWASTVFSYNITSYPAYFAYDRKLDFCNTGTPSQTWSTIPFPAVGGTASWTCLPSNDTLSCYAPLTCTARRSVPPPSDLIASTPSPSNASQGVSLTFNSTISNTGGQSTGTSFPNFFQIASSANGAGTKTDLPSFTIPALTGGASAIINSIAYTFSVAGTASVRACADKANSASSGLVTESNENNNCSNWQNVTVSSNPIPTIALTASPTSVISGGSATLTWVISNATSCSNGGNMPAGNWSTGTSGSVSTGALSSTKNYTLNCTGPGGSLSNNVTVSVTVPLPDLTASTPTPSTATTNISKIFSSTISNVVGQGTGASFSNFFQVATAANGGGTIINLLSSTMPALASGGSAITTTAYTFTSTGTYSIRACADKTNSSSLGVITEADEGNNCSGWQTVTVTNLPQPDLSLNTVSITTSPIITGGNINFRGTVTNTGTANAVSSVTQLQIDTNSSGTWTVGEPQTTQPTGALVAGASEVENLVLTFSAGTYQYRLCSDSSNAVVESDENNNCSTWTSFTVSPTPINGACNTSDGFTSPSIKNYTYNASSYSSGTFCNSGTPPSPNPAFPNQGGPVITWTCSGQNGGNPSTCKATRDSAPAQKRITVNVSTAGKGSVSIPQPSGPAVICTSSCATDYDVNYQVTLTATPVTGRIFTGWIGCDSVLTNTTSGGTCRMTADSDKSVTAKFGINPNFKEF